MLPQVRIALATADGALAQQVLLRLHSKGYQATGLPCMTGLLGAIYSDPPDLLIFDLSALSDECLATIHTLRSDSFFSAIPIIGLVASNDDGFDWEQCPLDDFVCLPINFSELFRRISLCLFRIKRIFDNNPLTRLPGNTSVQRAIEAAMGKPLAVCYLDINHFKPYNDFYGFSHGDVVIRMLARIMFNTVRENGGGFCGHVGGDDFVCIVPLERAETVSQTIIDHYDRVVIDLFDEETRTRGYYVGATRKGDVENIPLLSLSIAIVPMDSSKIEHIAKVGEVAAEIKKLAKESAKSCYVIDKRRT